MSIPLVIDLDGTLVRTDLLVESALGAIRRDPACLAKFPYWLALGKATLKSRLAERCELDVANLPYNEDVMRLATAAKQEGRTVVMATASHRMLAERVASHLGVFDLVLATESSVNLGSDTKREALVDLFGEGGFDYIGNSWQDLAVWRSARNALAVDPSRSIERSQRSSGGFSTIVRNQTSFSAAWLKALRLHQWTKNLLVFVPLIASHRFGEIDLVLSGLIAFIVFGLFASSAYLLNDLFDLADDRRHKTKHLRPFASGALQPIYGLIGSLALLAIGFILALVTLPLTFLLTVCGYYALTLAYSITLKRRMMVDVVVLSMLYTIRIVGGTVALGLSLTFWMLAFSTFIFLSLALVKRYAELKEARERGLLNKTPGRGYYPEDLEMIASLGASAGFISVLILAMYTQESATLDLYARPEVIWFSCPILLFWIGRIWMLTHRGEMNDDPVLFAIKDRISLFTGLIFGLVFLIAA